MLHEQNDGIGRHTLVDCQLSIGTTAGSEVELDAGILLHPLFIVPQTVR
ncbi:MAG: hypothetical protein PWQ62_437 [Candidatus Methanomethylophilaceae archaeon]|nr:hypothetical protein [Candidatus Methanomethylophilaceae archaeon]